MSSSFIIPTILIISALLIIAVVYYFDKKNSILRELKKGPKTSISRARQHEYVKLVGKVVGGNQPLKAPLSERPCAYYYVLVQRKGDKSWHTYLEEEEHQDFFLEVDGERAIIKPGQTQANLRRTHFEIDYEKKSSTWNTIEPHLEAYLQKNGKKSTGIFGFSKILRFREGIVEIGETIAIKGVAEWKSIEGSIEGYSYSRVLTLKGTTEHRLIITDHQEAVKPVKRKL